MAQPTVHLIPMTHSLRPGSTDSVTSIVERLQRIRDPQGRLAIAIEEPNEQLFKQLFRNLKDATDQELAVHTSRYENAEFSFLLHRELREMNREGVSIFCADVGRGRMEKAGTMIAQGVRILGLGQLFDEFDEQFRVNVLGLAFMREASDLRNPEITKNVANLVSSRPDMPVAAVFGGSHVLYLLDNLGGKVNGAQVVLEPDGSLSELQRIRAELEYKAIYSVSRDCRVSDEFAVARSMVFGNLFFDKVLRPINKPKAQYAQVIIDATSIGDLERLFHEIRSSYREGRRARRSLNRRRDDARRELEL